MEGPGIKTSSELIPFLAKNPSSWAIQSGALVALIVEKPIRTFWPGCAVQAAVATAAIVRIQISTIANFFMVSNFPVLRIRR
jgi:hypothetical protein